MLGFGSAIVWVRAMAAEEQYCTGILRPVYVLMCCAAYAGLAVASKQISLSPSTFPDSARALPAPPLQKLNDGCDLFG